MNELSIINDVTAAKCIIFMRISPHLRDLGPVKLEKAGYSHRYCVR
jgi:hypothetical protein